MHVFTLLVPGISSSEGYPLPAGSHYDTEYRPAAAWVAFGAALLLSGDEEGSGEESDWP